MTKILSILFILVPSFVFAQAIGDVERMGWDIPGSSLAEITAFEYGALVDGAPSVIVLNVTCVEDGGQFSCTGDFPSMTPGMHSLTLTARRISGNTGVTSMESNILMVDLLIAAGIPTNLRIEP